MPLRARGELAEIVFVDDGSTDDTRAIVAEFPVTVVAGEGRGPGAARNLGWRAAAQELIWFIDSDCVAEPDALARLVACMADPRVGGAGGSYGNMVPDSLLACLIHEEIVARHATMPARVNYLATFNVVYRRSVLMQVGGFDERFVTAEDCELSWRILAEGCELAFDPASQVRHFHPARWRPYLRTQRRHGYYRALLYMTHPQYAHGDAYSGFVDHVQPPLALMVLATLPLLFFARAWWIPVVGAVCLLAAQAPIMLRLMRRTRQAKYAAFAPMGFVRAFWRGVGLAHGTLAAVFRRGRGRT